MAMSFIIFLEMVIANQWTLLIYVITSTVLCTLCMSQPTSIRIAKIVCEELSSYGKKEGLYRSVVKCMIPGV